jgi:predicted lipoprotein
MLTSSAERGTAWMFMARIGVMQALNRNEVCVFNPDRKDIGKGIGSKGTNKPQSNAFVRL